MNRPIDWTEVAEKRADEREDRMKTEAAGTESQANDDPFTRALIAALMDPEAWAKGRRESVQVGKQFTTAATLKTTSKRYPMEAKPHEMHCNQSPGQSVRQKCHESPAGL